MTLRLPTPRLHVLLDIVPFQLCLLRLHSFRPSCQSLVSVRSLVHLRSSTLLRARLPCPRHRFLPPCLLWILWLRWLLRRPRRFTSPPPRLRRRPLLLSFRLTHLLPCLLPAIPSYTIRLILPLLRLLSHRRLRIPPNYWLKLLPLWDLPSPRLSKSRKTLLTTSFLSRARIRMRISPVGIQHPIPTGCSSLVWYSHDVGDQRVQRRIVTAPSFETPSLYGFRRGSPFAGSGDRTFEQRY